MKIVVASSGLGHVARGIEAWANDLGHALAERGIDVTVCKGGGRPAAPHERVLTCSQRSADSTKHLLRWLPRRLGWRIGLGSAYEVEQTSFALNLIDHLRRTRADIVHVQDPQVARRVQQANRLGLLPTRAILAHGTEEAPCFLEKITYLQHLAPWHLQSTREAGAWKPTWTAIPNFIDTNRFHPGRCDALRVELNIPANALVLLCVAALKRKHKRVDHLLSEFAALRQSDPTLSAWLVIAGGSEPGSDELIDQGQRLLGDRVRFLPGFPRDRMPDLYRSADLFTLCSLKEMMPIALLEATASGLPALVHHHPVLQWITGPGGQALAMDQPGALAAAARRLFQDQHARRRFGEAARRHCCEHFSVNRVVDEVLEYYRFVIRTAA